ncbi:unnamed protein product, partial [Ectocarpus sp. 4 AP-2014]
GTKRGTHGRNTAVVCGRNNKHHAAQSSCSIQPSVENVLVSRCSMGIDRRSWACQSKRASSSSDNEGTLVDASPSSPAARNSATPQDDRGYCRESTLGRNEFPGGIGAVGSDRRPWVNQASYLEVTRSPSYLKGTAGLTLSPSPAAAAAAVTGTTTQHLKAVVARSPSSTTVMESPPAPVRTGRPSRPRRAAAAAAAATAAGGGVRVPPLGCGGGGGGGGGVAQGQHLLPPPAIRREVCSGLFKSDARNSCGRGGAGSSDVVAVAKRPSPLRYLSPAREQQKGEIFSFGRSSRSGGNEGRKREVFYFGKSGGGDLGGTPSNPGPGQPAPSTPRVGQHRSRPTGTDGEHLPPETRGAAFPMTPKVARGPDTPGYASTPCIFSPPAPLHRGITGSGQPRASSRLSIGVDCSGPNNGSGRPPPPAAAAAAAAAAGDDCGQGLAAGWAEGEENFVRSGTTAAAAARRPARARRKCRLNQRKPNLADDSDSCGESATEADADGDEAETSGGLRGDSEGSGGSSAAESCRRERSTNRKEELLDAASSERFSEEFCGRDGRGGGAGQGSGAWARARAEAYPKERGVSRRRRRKKKPVVRRDEETLIDFKGRMAAIASATRLAAAATATATTSSRNAFVMATPPHPISSSAPPLPRRRLLSAASPSLSPPPPAADAAPEGRCPLSGGGSSNTRRPSAADGSPDPAAGSSSVDADNVVAGGSSEVAWGGSSSGSAWSTPERRGKGGEKPGRAAAAAAVAVATAGLDGGVMASPKREGAAGRSAVRPLRTTLKPSERTAPKTRPWPDFERIRYEPQESAVTTPLRRSDWKVPHGSAMHALAAALDEAAGSTACSSPLDMRQEGRESVRRRYQERADYFRLIQAARETSAGKGSAMLLAMRQRRQAEEAALRATREREARAAWIKERILMRMLEGRKAAFFAWAKHARVCRNARHMVKSRTDSLSLRVLTAWRGEAYRSRRIREFVIKHVSGSKRATFMAWKESTRKSVAMRKMALSQLQGGRKSCFYAWREATRTNVRRRELALEKSALARSALSGLAGTRSRFVRWRAWARRRAGARRMALRAREAWLQRCFLALAGNQLRLRQRLQERRMSTLAAVFQGWRVGLGRLLRARLAPNAERGTLTADDGTPGGGGGGGGGGTPRDAMDGAHHYSSVGVEGWGFAPAGEEEKTEAFCPVEGGAGSTDFGGGGAGDTADRGRIKRSEASGVGEAVALDGDAVSPTDGGATGARVLLLPPSAFFASGKTLVATKAMAEEEVGASVEEAGTGRWPGGGDGSTAVEEGCARGSHRGASRHRKRRPRKGGDGSSRRAQSP